VGRRDREIDKKEREQARGGSVRICVYIGFISGVEGLHRQLTGRRKVEVDFAIVDHTVSRFPFEQDITGAQEGRQDSRRGDEKRAAWSTGKGQKRKRTGKRQGKCQKIPLHRDPDVQQCSLSALHLLPASTCCASTHSSNCALITVCENALLCGEHSEERVCSGASVCVGEVAVANFCKHSVHASVH